MKKWEKPMLNDLSVRKTTAHTDENCQNNPDGTATTPTEWVHCDYCEEKFATWDEAYRHEFCVHGVLADGVGPFQCS